jgi:N-acetylneuraminate 9-O-acetyltransferase
MQYHYYRARFVYNEIRVFVSAYVFLTGWGNYQYFTKKQDFSMERGISMWLRINYFPLLLCAVVGTKLDDFYIVPLHTTGFFITMATCYVAKLLEGRIKNAPTRNLSAIGISLLAHVFFYETPAVNFLKLFSNEIFFRFQADKYSCWVGILVGFLWDYLKKAIQFYNSEQAPNTSQKIATVTQIGIGLTTIVFWYGLFGHIRDKFTYNPIHPYVFWIPIAGWLTIRNASKYLMEIHCGVLEFFGRITLETYVLQFHLFMCRHVQHIPIVIPGAGPNGPLLVKTLNMLLTGTVFVTTAYYARHTTVTTQTTVTELLVNVVAYTKTGEWPVVLVPKSNDDDDDTKQDMVPLVTKAGDAEVGSKRKQTESV